MDLRTKLELQKAFSGVNLNYKIPLYAVLKGSQNYNLSDEKSDYDIEMVYSRTLSGMTNFLLSKSRDSGITIVGSSSIVHSFPIEDFLNRILTGLDLNTFEFLFSPNGIFNGEKDPIIELVLFKRDDFYWASQSKLIKSMYSAARFLEIKGYLISNKVINYGEKFSGKELANFLRTIYTVNRIYLGLDPSEILWNIDATRDLIMGIKRETLDIKSAHEALIDAILVNNASEDIEEYFFSRKKKALEEEKLLLLRDPIFEVYEDYLRKSFIDIS